MPFDVDLRQGKQEHKAVPDGHDSPHDTSQGACRRQLDTIRKPIKSWVNKRGDGQFTPNHQSSDNDRNDIQNFHYEFPAKEVFFLRRNAATIVM